LPLKYFLFLHDSHGFLQGARGFAGEIGHIPWHGSQNASWGKCFCGRYDCLETYLSPETVLKFAAHELGIVQPGLPELYAAATPYQMQKIYEYLISFIKFACVVAANIFDPEMLILGGKVIEPWIKRFEKELLPELRRTTWHNSPKKLKCYSMQNCSSAYGSALKAAAEAVTAIVGSYTE
jgi:predicted NBD/HSP70 family sugar kinase